MKSVIAVGAGVLLVGCSTTQTALWSGNYDAAFALMQGEGTMIQQPDGRQGFRYAISANAFEGLPGDPEETRRKMLSQWLGNTQGCPKGYDVKRTEAGGAVIYEGVCK